MEFPQVVGERPASVRAAAVERIFAYALSKAESETSGFGGRLTAR
jgi:hypothetical protein